MKSRLKHHTPQYIEKTEGGFNRAYHLEMIKDEERVSRICAALDENLKPDDTFCELGAGTGLFSIYAAKRCQKVYAVEKDPQMIQIAWGNIKRAGLQHKIELIEGDALEFELSPRADCLLLEMMSVWCINEPQIPVMNHALQQVLKKGGKSIPARIVNLIELGHYTFGYREVECRASFAQFTGIRAPRIMSASQVFNEYRFDKETELFFEKEVEVEMLLSGPVNCARLSSLVQLSPSCTFFSTDSLMPLSVVPLDKEIRVEAGEKIRLNIAFQLRSSLDKAKFKVLSQKH